MKPEDIKKAQLKQVIDKSKVGDVNDIIDFYLRHKKELGFKKPSDMLKWYYK